MIDWFEAIAPALVQATLSAPQVRAQSVKKVELRPVELRGKMHFQIVSYEATKCLTKNVAFIQLQEVLKELFKLYKNIFIRTKKSGKQLGLNLRPLRIASGMFAGFI